MTNSEPRPIDGVHTWRNERLGVCHRRRLVNTICKMLPIYLSGKKAFPIFREQMSDRRFWFVAIVVLPATHGDHNDVKVRYMQLYMYI